MSTLAFFLLVAAALVVCYADDDHEHVIIHVPYYIKTIRQTRTITKPKEHDEDKWEVLGYTIGHPVIDPFGDHFEVDGWKKEFQGGYQSI